MTTEEALCALRELHEAAGGTDPEVVEISAWQSMSPCRRIVADPAGALTLAGAREAYVRGDIEVDEFEHRVGLLVAAGRCS